MPKISFAKNPIRRIRIPSTIRLVPDSISLLFKGQAGSSLFHVVLIRTWVPYGAFVDIERNWTSCVALTQYLLYDTAMAICEKDDVCTRIPRTVRPQYLHNQPNLLTCRCLTHVLTPTTFSEKGPFIFVDFNSRIKSDCLAQTTDSYKQKHYYSTSHY